MDLPAPGCHDQRQWLSASVLASGLQVGHGHGRHGRRARWIDDSLEQLLTPKLGGNLARAAGSSPPVLPGGEGLEHPGHVVG